MQYDLDRIQTLNKEQETLEKNPEKNLWGAVLCLGITEALNGKLDALLWLLDEGTTEVGEFGWICEGIFGADPTYLRRLIFSEHRSIAKHALKNFRNHYTKAYNRKPVKALKLSNNKDAA